MKTHLSIAFSLIHALGISQVTAAELDHLREEHRLELSDTSYHVLNNKEIEHFEGLDYFQFDSTFQIVAKFNIEKGRKFEMATSTDRKPWYRKYGVITFSIDDTSYSMEVYQNLSLKKDKEYKNYLFVPFRDKTSGISTYGGGRYLDIQIPENEVLILDFNLAYNPYCAYSYRYSCPIPPAINTLKVEINAGEKTPKGHE